MAQLTSTNLQSCKLIQSLFINSTRVIKYRVLLQLFGLNACASAARCQGDPDSLRVLQRSNYSAVNHVSFNYNTANSFSLSGYSSGNMPADYSSTARALALPVSPQPSPLANHNPHPPPWTRRRSSQSLGRNQPSRAPGAGFTNQLMDNAEKLQRKLYRTVKKLTPVQRGLAVVAAVIVVVVGILFLVFNERIFAWLEPFAESWKNLRGGWLILWAMTFTTAFPPIIGYSTCVTIAGFVYGFPKG